MRLKLVSNNQSTERRFSSWIGGSILGSLVSWEILHFRNHVITSHVTIAPNLEIESQF